MNTKPYAYQRIGVSIIQNKFNGRTLLADEMGMGKTLQALLWKHKYLIGGPTIIVCPAALKWQWQAQCNEHFGLRAEVLSGKKPPKYNRGMFRPKGVFIVNYDILGSPDSQDETWLKFLIKLKPKLIIGDEVHMIQNQGSIRSKAMRKLCKGVKKIILMSGTPATSFPAQLWPALNILCPTVFNSFYSFTKRFCERKITPWGPQFTGAKRIPKLSRLLRKHCMIRRLKEDVLKDLPPKTYCVIPVEIKRRKEYELAEADLVQWLLSQKKVRQANRAMSSERLVRIGYLKRLAAELKMDEVIKWIENFLEETGRKLIVFGIHKARIKELKERFGSKAVVVDGTVTGERRQQAVDAFNKNKKIRLFLGNVDAAGVGWSCKSASDVMFFEFPWVPGKLSQASDRIHGVGRGIAGRKAFIHFLVAHSTIEEKLVEVLQKKQIVLSKLFDGGSRDTDLNVLDLMEDALTKRNK